VPHDSPISPLVSMKVISTNTSHWSMQIQLLPMFCVFIMPLVKELEILLYKCGDIKLYLCRTWQIIIFVNFWDFFHNVWTTLKFKSDSKSRKFRNLHFKICADLEVCPLSKVDPLDQIYHHRVSQNCWKLERLLFLFSKFGCLNRIWIIVEIQKGCGPRSSAAH
jgi:hypothetical protein